MADETEFAQTKLNSKLGSFGVLKPSSLRYKFIQYLGYLLWGRKIGSLSWWPRAGRSSGVLLCNNGKILIGQRRNMTDQNSKFSWPAGYADKGENLAQGLSREIWEETRLKIGAENFNLDTLIAIREFYGDIAEMHETDSIALSYYYFLPDSELANIEETHEMHNFKWVDEAELDQIFNRGEMAYTGEYNIMKKSFKDGIPAKTLPPA